MTKTKKEDKQHYIDNKQFLQSLIEYKKEVNTAKDKNEERPQCPDYIGDCFIKIANHLAFKSNFINYSFREDMILDAIENCLIYMDNFDPKKSSNPFAYFTQITYYAFLRRIQKEKKQLHTKYRYVESLDIAGLVRQAHDEGNYDNGFIRYLKNQADTAQRELSDTKKEKKQMTRKPKYLQKLEDESLMINEADHIEIQHIIMDKDSEIGEIDYE
jgi:DNA-directed RNA polymerase specialized sigma24 family protein